MFTSGDGRFGFSFPSRQQRPLCFPTWLTLICILAILLLFSLAVLLAIFCLPSHVVTTSRIDFDYGTQMVRGVNLGGWLVVEPWLAQSLFMSVNDSRIIDEWTFCQYQDLDVAANALRQHWETFITETDFLQIALAGLNHVRIPVPYYTFDVQPGEPYIQGQLEYLDKAVKWASTYKLKVIIDLHAGPGSQNGFDNSGQITTTPMWANNTDYVKRTVDVVHMIAQRYQSSSDVVSMIEPLNEPAGFLGAQVLDVVKKFYYDSYNAIRWPNGDSGKKNNMAILLSDAFQNSTYWREFMPQPQWDGVMVDRHVYQIYSDPEITRTWDEHIQYACHNISQEFVNSTLWQITGEWSLATTDCCVSPNIFSKGLGSRWDGTTKASQAYQTSNTTRTSALGSCQGVSGNATTFSPEYKTFLRKYWEAQVDALERAGKGWLMWTWKAENADEWSYLTGLQNGWIPWNVTERLYPHLCNAAV